MSEWIRWKGGQCPVGRDELVDVKWLNGDIFEKQPAGQWLWNIDVDAVVEHEDEDSGAGVICAYRISNPAASTPPKTS